MTTFSGTVYDPDGNVQTNAPVAIINSDTDSVETEVMTDSDGQYSTDVPGGYTYHVATRYDDGSGNQFTALSKPFISTVRSATTIDDFEDNDSDEYVVADGSETDKTDLRWSDSNAYEGSWAMGRTSSAASSWLNLISHPDNTNLADYLPVYPVRGDTLRYYTRGTADSGTRLQWAVQNTTHRDDLYNCRWSPRDGEFSVRVRQGGSYVQTGGSTSGVSVPANQWCEITIDWLDDGNGDTFIDATCIDLSDGSEVATASLTDTSVNFSGGGIGWGFWGSTSTGGSLVDYLHIV